MLLELVVAAAGAAEVASAVPFRHIGRTDGQLPLQSLYRKGHAVLGYAGLFEPEEDMTAATRRALEALATGRLSVPVDSAVPLRDVNDAFDRIQQRKVRGKLVLGTGNGQGRTT